MSTLLCKGCSGQYDTVQVDGTRYFHACPQSVAPADQRNENVPSTDAKDVSKVKAAGKDVTVLKA